MLQEGEGNLQFLDLSYNWEYNFILIGWEQTNFKIVNPLMPNSDL